MTRPVLCGNQPDRSREMCDGHSNVIVDIGHKTIGVDGCIAPLVKALNDAGYRTLASCCGHGNQPANIPLIDLDGVERWIILTADRDEGERLMWPDAGVAAGPQATPPTPDAAQRLVDLAQSVKDGLDGFGQLDDPTSVRLHDALMASAHALDQGGFDG